LFKSIQEILKNFHTLTNGCHNLNLQLVSALLLYLS